MNFSPMRTWMYGLAAIAGFMLAGSVAGAQGFGSTPAPATRNLLINGTFEKGAEGWTFDSYGKKGVMTWDENEKHGGHPSVRIENPSAEDSHLNQKVAVAPETRYRLEAYIKTKDVLAENRNSKGGACVDLDGTWQRSMPAVDKTKSWTRVTQDIVTGAQTEIEIGGRLGFWSDGVTGTAWFADFTLVKIGKAPPRR